MHGTDAGKASDRMSWTKLRRSLTEEQRRRGVIFSSALVRKGEREGDVIHEVFDSDEDKWDKIDRLSDVSFFKKMAREEGYVVREIVRR